MTKKSERGAVAVPPRALPAFYNRVVLYHFFKKFFHYRVFQNNKGKTLLRREFVKKSVDIGAMHTILFYT